MANNIREALSVLERLALAQCATEEDIAEQQRALALLHSKNLKYSNVWQKEEGGLSQAIQYASTVKLNLDRNYNRIKGVLSTKHPLPEQRRYYAIYHDSKARQIGTRNNLVDIGSNLECYGALMFSNPQEEDKIIFVNSDRFTHLIQINQEEVDSFCRKIQKTFRQVVNEGVTFVWDVPDTEHVVAIMDSGKIVDLVKNDTIQSSHPLAERVAKKEYMQFTHGRFTYQLGNEGTVEIVIKPPPTYIKTEFGQELEKRIRAYDKQNSS